MTEKPTTSFPAHEWLNAAIRDVAPMGPMELDKLRPELDKEFNQLRAMCDEMAGVLELCDRGFKKGRLKDQSILPISEPGATQIKLLVLSEIVSDALSKYEQIKEGKNAG